MGRPFFSRQGMGGRSRCMQCDHTLGALDLVPLFSYLFLRGRCRYCGSHVSWQYPLVEAVAGVLSAGVYVLNPNPLSFAFWFVVWMMLLFISIYDIKHTIIPWSCSFVLLALACVHVVFSFDTLSLVLPAPWVLMAGPLLALPLFLLSFVSRGTWMGWADSLLELSLGALLGLSLGATALMLAFWSGALVGIVLLVLSRFHIFRYTIKSELPFAPFLILGAGLAYFFHVDFFSSITLFY